MDLELTRTNGEYLWNVVRNVEKQEKCKLPEQEKCNPMTGNVQTQGRKNANLGQEMFKHWTGNMQPVNSKFKTPVLFCHFLMITSFIFI